jgi:methyl-accepting chemotaxis protein
LKVFSKGGIVNFINDLRIKNKLVLMLILPMAGLLFFSIYGILDKHGQQREMSNLQNLSGLAVKMSSLVHEIQKERGITALFLGSKQARFASQLSEQSAETDKRMQDLQMFLKGFARDKFEAEFKKSIDNALRNLESIKNKRDAAGAMSISAAEAFEYYTNTISSFLDVVGSISKSSNNAELANLTSAYVNLLQAKERAGRERGILSNTFANDKFEPGMFHKFLSVVTEQTAYVTIFLSHAAADQKSFYETKMQGHLIDEAAKMRKIALERSDKGGFGVDADHSFKIQTGKINLLKEVEDRLSNDLNQKAKQHKNSARSMLMVFLVITIVAVLASIFMAYIVIRSITHPVDMIAAISRKIADGDLNIDIDVNSKDEIGNLSSILKETLRSLGVVLLRIKELAGKISKVAEDVEGESKHVVKGSEIEAEAVANISLSVEELKATATEISDNTESLAASVGNTANSMEQMASSISNVNDNIHALSTAVESTSSSIEELSATLKEVASNAEELANASEETLSAVSEISSTIKEVEANAKESARLSEKTTSEAATFGMTSIDKTMEGMKNIKSSVERTADFIKKLGGRSEEIGKILTVIDEVTDQTTLLALNAAILAAQAGEHGKGFSVVADEIKDLAERTAFSTQEIASLIQAVQQEVKSSGQAMQAGLASVEEGFRLSREAGDALRKILDSSRKSSEMATSIERSTAEQSKAAKLVAEAMERVRNMTDHIAKSTAEQSKGISLIIKATEQIKNISVQVTKTTEEQTLSSRQVSQAMEFVSEKSLQISKSLIEHKIGSMHISNTVDGIKGVPVENRKIAFRVSNTIRELYNDAELLKTEVERFRFIEEKGTVIRLGVVPLEAPAVMFKKFSPLANYLSRRLNKTVELKVAIDYADAVSDIGNNATQLCYMTPSTYIEANKKYSGINVLVKVLREGKPYHHTVIITKADSDIRSVEDLKGRTFAFGNIHSTSGHIIPRSMLKDAGIDIDQLQYYNYFGHHDDVAKAVLKGDFDAGGVMESTAYKYKEQGVNLLKFSDEIPEFNICCNSFIDERDISIIKTSLVSLDESSAEGAAILKSLDKSYTGFMEAYDTDYDSIRAKMLTLGMLQAVKR